MNLTMRMLQSAAFAVAGLTLITARVQAVDNDPITTWTFEASVPLTAGPHNAEFGTGQASSNTGGAFTNPTGNGSAESFSSNGWNVGEYFQFTTSTVGSTNIGLYFDQISSNTGPKDFQVSYSLDGSSFTDIGSPYVVRPNVDPFWGSGSNTGLDTFAIDFRPVTVLNNAASVFFRLTNTTTVSANGATIATTGTNRIDNVSVVKNFVAPDDPPPLPDPRLPVAGDLVFGLATGAGTSIELVAGNLTSNGGVGGPGPWSSAAGIQSVRFDNYGGVKHNVDGNLLGVRFSSSGTGQIYSFGTNTAIPAPDGQLIGNTGATDPVGQSGSLTAVSIGGISVAPSNGKVVAYGQRNAVAASPGPPPVDAVPAFSSIIVYDYTPGDTTGSGASLANGREIELDLNNFEAQGGRTQGVAWLSNTKAVTFSPQGTVTEITDNGTTLSKQVVASHATPAVGSDYTSIAYNSDISPYLYAMYSGFADNESTATLYVLDPNNSYSLVKMADFSDSIGTATAREIALDADGNLFVSGFGGVINYIPNVVTNPAAIANNSSVLWYNSTQNPQFTGIDIGFAAAGQPGDFNGDGKVNAADYTVWRDNLNGNSSVLNGNGSGAATVVAADYDLWKANFGAGGPGAGGLAGGAVPEPTSAMLMLIAIVGLAAGRRSVR